MKGHQGKVERVLEFYRKKPINEISKSQDYIDLNKINSRLQPAVNLLHRSFVSEYIDEDVIQRLLFQRQQELGFLSNELEVTHQEATTKCLRGWMTCLSVALAIWMPRSILCQTEFSLSLSRCLLYIHHFFKKLKVLERTKRRKQENEAEIFSSNVCFAEISVVRKFAMCQV